MMKVYDMVTCSLYAPEQQAGDGAMIDQPRTRLTDPLGCASEVALQLLQPARPRSPDLHPALHQTDIDSFLAGIDR